METLIVGVDVSKESFSVAGLDSSGARCFTDAFPMDSEGFSKFLKTITDQQPEISAIVVGMESTGCYHINVQESCDGDYAQAHSCSFCDALTSAILYRNNCELNIVD